MLLLRDLGAKHVGRIERQLDRKGGRPSGQRYCVWRDLRFVLGGAQDAQTKYPASHTVGVRLEFYRHMLLATNEIWRDRIIDVEELVRSLAFEFLRGNNVSIHQDIEHPMSGSHFPSMSPATSWAASAVPPPADR